MCQGKIVEEGTTDEIFTNPSHIYTKILLDSIPKIGTEFKYTRDVDLEDDTKYQEVMRNLKTINFIKTTNRIHIMYYLIFNIKFKGGRYES